MLIVATFVFIRWVWNNRTSANDVHLRQLALSVNAEAYALGFNLQAQASQPTPEREQELTRQIAELDAKLSLLHNGGPYLAHGKTVNLLPLPTEFSFKLNEIEGIWHEARTGAITVVESLAKNGGSSRGGVANLPASQATHLRAQVRTHLNLAQQALPRLAQLSQRLSQELDERFRANQQWGINGLYLLMAVCVGFIVFMVIDIGKASVKPIAGIQTAIDQLGQGRSHIEVEMQNPAQEVANIVDGIHQVADYIQNSAHFAAEVGKGNFVAQLTPRSEGDELGQALLNMRDELKKAAEEEQRRRWAAEGNSQFADLLRTSNQDLKELANQVLAHLVKYLGANQGSLFTLEGQGKNAHLVLQAAYAYDKRKYLEKEVKVGVGLLGQAVLEGSPAYYTHLPNGYVEITSGLGETTPGSLLIVPLKIDELVYGAVEIASFEPLAPHQIDFVSRLSERIANTLATVKNNQKMRLMLEETQANSEQMRAQEEEMRQNMEELLATQEEMQRMQAELRKKETSLNALINQTETAIYSLDNQFNVVIANDALKRLVRREFGKEIRAGSSIFEWVAPRFQANRRQHLARALGGQHFTVVENHKGADHADLYYEMGFSPLYDDDRQVSGVSVFMRDITHLHPIRWE
ncbi:MAG: GAF domain-containing protein [Bernardetiaceae bacterium]|nr:GAF domain-containing protein [Bernardetiaceae bacterium]